MRTTLLMSAVLTGVIAIQAIRRLSGKNSGSIRSSRFATFGAILVLNFMVYWWVGGLCGGDALNGKIVGDQYFLGDHGRYTQVSMAFWVYSLTHAWVTILSYVVLFGWLIVGGISGRIDLPSDGDELHPRGRGTV